MAVRVYWLVGLARERGDHPCALFSFRHVHLPLGLVWWIER